MDKLRILYIEDDDKERRDFERQLRSKEFDVISASSGKSGLKLLKDHSVDIVLCDLNMPGLSGLDVLAEIGLRKLETPVILLSAHGSISLAVQAIKQGAYDFIPKPLEINKTARAMRKAVQEVSLKKEVKQSEAAGQGIKELEKKAFSLGLANIEMLAVQEELEEKNIQMEKLLTDLSNRKDELQAILDTSPAAIVMVSGDNKITSANKRIGEFFGLKSSEVINKSFDSFIRKIKPCFDDFEAYLHHTRQIEDLCIDCDPHDFDLAEIFTHAIRVVKPVPRLIVPLPATVRDKSGAKLGRIWIYNDITEQKKADELLRTIVDASPIPFVVSRFSNGKMLYANKPLAHILNLPPEELVGKQTPDFYANPRDRQEVLRILERDGAVYDHEVQIKKADGEVVWMIFSLITTILNGEKVIVGALYDINERRKAEEALRESEEKFRQLTENIHEAFWMYDVKSQKTTYVSPAFEDITGYKRDVLLQNFEKFIEAIHPDDRERVRAAMERDIDSEYDEEYRIIKPDGEMRWILERAFPIFDKEGEVYRLCGVAEDITERKLASDALKQERNFVSAVLDTAGALVVVLDRKGKIVRFNSACEEVTGYSFQEVRGKIAWEVFILPEEIEQVKSMFSELSSGQFPNEGEIYWKVKNGKPRLISWANTVLLDDAGNVEYIIATGIDVTERRKTEEALRKSEQALRTIFNSVYDAIIIHDDKGNILDVNDKMLELYKVSREDALNSKVQRDLSGPQNPVDKLPDMWRKVMSGEPLFFEWIATRPGDGSLFDVEVFLRKIVLGDREVILANVRDITARKKAEENLRLYRKIFMNSNDPILILNPEGVILEVNPAAEYLSGYPESELIGKTTGAVFGERPFAAMFSSLPEKGNYAIRKELKVQSRQGKDLVVEISAFPILNENGAPIYRVGFARDITERKRAEEALQKAHDELEIRVRERTAELAKVNETLRASEARNTALLNAIPDLMFRLRKDGIYIDYKAPKESDLAVPAEDIIGKNVFDTLPPELAEQTMVQIDQTLNNSDTQIMEYKLPHDEHLHYFEARLVVSGPDEVLAIVRDITERKEAEEALRRAHDELEMRVEERTAELAKAYQELRQTHAQLIQSEKMAALGTLVAGIAHEINTPVGAINSMHNTLVRAVEKLKQIIDAQFPGGFDDNPRLIAILKAVEDANRVIASGSQRVTTIVKRLRSFARLDEAELKEADIQEGIEDTLVLIQHEIKHNINLIKNYGELPKISCYPGKLNQVLLNLLINAKQALLGKEDGTITISTRHESGKVHISVTDNGGGIPEKHLQKIFDPGFTTKGVGVGTGLGLSIVYQIVKEDHRGEITVDSKTGEGTTFTVSIPDNLDELVEHT